MKEIKFRAWDKTNKVLIYFGLRSLDLGIANVDIANKRSDYMIMQFTGLKDKNGKEIYEGDIVKYSRSQSDLSIFNIGEIVWYQQGFRIRLGENYHFLNEVYIEVIGNIYEYPELLEEKLK